MDCFTGETRCSSTTQYPQLLRVLQGPRLRQLFLTLDEEEHMVVSLAAVDKELIDGVDVRL